jgi:hypothetical protein
LHAAITQNKQQQQQSRLTIISILFQEGITPLFAKDYKQTVIESAATSNHLQPRNNNTFVAAGSNHSLWIQHSLRTLGTPRVKLLCVPAARMASSSFPQKCI